MKKVALWLLLLPIVLSVVVGGLLLSPTSNTQELSRYEARSLKQLKRQFSSVHGGETRQLQLSSQDCNLLLQHGIELTGWPLQGAVNLQNNTGELQLSWHSQLPWWRYINMRLNFHNDGEQLTWGGAKIGRLSLSARWMNYLHRRFAAQLLSQIHHSANTFWQLPDQVAIAEQSLMIRFNTAREQEQLAALFGSDTLARLPFYQQQLALNFAQQRGRISLGTALAKLFEIAEQQSDSDPLVDNRAIILSLFLHTSDHRDLQMIDWPSTLIPKSPLQLTLHQRQDLAGHWLATASISLLANRQVAEAISMYKELLDGQQNKGMDVSDLIANQAGSLLAGLLAEANGPRQQQRLLAQLSSDQSLLPLEAGLEQSLQQQLSADTSLTALYQDIEQQLMRRELFQQLARY